MAQLTTVGFSQQQINPWNNAVDVLFDHCDDSDLENIRMLCRLEDENEGEPKEEQDQTTYIDEKAKLRKQFVDMLDRHEDKLKLALELRDSLRCLNIQTYSGEKFTDIIKEVIDMYQDVEASRRELFVGRDKIIQHIVCKLTSHGHPIGVLITALAGQGKSAVAKQVSYNVQYEHGWTVYRLDLRDRDSVKDVIVSLLGATSVYGSIDNQTTLTQELTTVIQSLEQDTMFMLDNCEAAMEKERNGFVDFLKTLFETVIGHRECSTQIKFLLTSRRKVNIDKKCKLTEQLTQLVLDPLDEEEAKELLKKSSGKEVVDEVADEIVSECACSPLAITMTAGMLKHGKLNPENLVFHLKMDQRNVIKALMVKNETKAKNCIETTINWLDKHMQNELVRLSVFQSGSFEKSSADMVVSKPSVIKTTLDILIDFHMIELDDKSFCLQPLVYRYIQEWKKPKHLQDALNEANGCFVELYEKIINKIVKYYDTKCLRGVKMLEKHRMHILRFYDLLETDTTLKLYTSTVKSLKFVLRKKRVSDLADLLLSDAKKKRLFQKESERAKEAGNDAMYAFWVIELADVLVVLHDKAGLAEQKLDSLTNGKFTSLRGLHKEIFYPALVHALFHKVKGLIRLNQRDYGAAVDHLKLAIHFYGKWCPSYSYDTLKSRVYCKLAQAYIPLGKYDCAKEVLDKGLQLIPKWSDDDGSIRANNAGDSVPKVDDINDVIPSDAPKFHELFGKVQLEQARREQTNSPLHQKYLDQAMQHFQKGLRLDLRLKLDTFDRYCEKHYCLAEVYIENGQLSEALKHAKFSRDRRYDILQPPHIKYTLSVYQVALILQLIGDDNLAKGDKEQARNNWIESRDCYSELEDHHLINGGISTDDHRFNEIKRNHMRLAADLGDDQFLNKITKLYRDIDQGHYKAKERSILKDFQKMKFTPSEVLKKMFRGGGKKFGEMDYVLQDYQEATGDQIERMLRGEPAGDRHDPRRDNSSSELGEPLPSGSGSASVSMSRLQVQKSMSLEDEVSGGNESTTQDQALKIKEKRAKKRMKTETS